MLNFKLMHQSIPAVPTAGHFLTLSVPGVWPSQFYRGPGARKDEAFVEQWLVCQGLDKLVDVF